MSSADLSQISRDRPDLVEAVNALQAMLVRKPSLRTLDLDTLLQEIGGVVSVVEIIELLHELRERGVAKLVYRVKDKQGYRTAKKFQSLTEKPEHDIDRNGQDFEVELSNIEQTYELAQ